MTDKSIKDMRSVMENPVAWEKIQAKDRFRKQLSKEEERLKNITPPDLTPTEQSEWRQRIKKMAHAYINGNPAKGIPPMNSEKEQWDMPAGAVGSHTTHERFWKSNTINENGDVVPAKDGYGLTFELKDKLRAVNKEREQDDPDVANLEQFRPRDPLGGGSKFIDFPSMTTAPGKNHTHESWAEATGHEPTPNEAAIIEAEKDLEHKKMVDNLLAKAASDPEFMDLLKDVTGVKETEFIQCKAITKSGEQCKREAVVGTEHCNLPTHKSN